MIITNNLDKYKIDYPFEIGDALKKIEENSIGGLIVLKEKNYLALLQMVISEEV